MADNFAEMNRVAEQLVHDSVPGLLRSTQHLDKEDLAQEALVRFLAIKNLASVESPTAYLGRIFRHVIWERRKADARNAAFMTTAYDPIESTVERSNAPVVAGPEAKLSVSQEIDAALAGLSETRRNVYVLKTFGLSYREIAAELNLTRHTVKKYVCEAQQYCRALAKGKTWRRKTSADRGRRHFGASA